MIYQSQCLKSTGEKVNGNDIMLTCSYRTNLAYLNNLIS